MIKTEMIPVYKNILDSNYTALESIIYSYIRFNCNEVKVSCISEWQDIIPWEKYEVIFWAISNLKKKEVIVETEDDWYIIYTCWDKIKKKPKKREVIKTEEDIQKKADKNSELQQRVISFISKFKNVCNELNLVYNNREEWRYAKHILTTKAFWEATERWWWWSREELAILLLKFSHSTPYCKKIYWPYDLYYWYVTLLNKYMDIKNGLAEVKQNTFTFWQQ